MAIKTLKTKQIKETVDSEVDSEMEDTFSCIACQGAAYESFKPLPEQEYSGVRHGKAFTTIIRTVVKCTACGQMSVLMTYK